MATAELTRTRVRVPMLWPDRVTVSVAIAAMRADPSDDAELVDQAQFGETLRLLGERDGWAWVQGEADHYFGWVRAEHVRAAAVDPEGTRVVSTLLAPVRERPEPDAALIAELPAGTPIARTRGSRGWLEVHVDGRAGFIAPDDVTPAGDLPHRPPAAADLIATMEAFLGTPYLWGGTTGHGIDCSGLVQQVYRLNGVGLDRDADQQALEGRSADVPRAGDLLFFGKDSVTHVALATGEETFIHAPMSGAFVERSGIGPERTPRAIRRYLMPDRP